MIPEGYKYASFALHTGIGAIGDPAVIAPGLVVSSKPFISVPEHWTASLGTFALSALADADVHITAFAPSKTLELLDQENERLRSRVQHVYSGLLLGTPGIRVLHGRSLTGSHHPDGDFDLRSTYQLNNVYHVVGASRDTRIEAKHLRLAHEIGEGLRGQRSSENAQGHGDFGRFKRCISAMYSCVESRTLTHRLHQAVRVIEGIMGAGNERFSDAHIPRIKNHLLLGASDLLALPRTLYTLRSKVEHLYGEEAAVRLAELLDTPDPKASYVRFAAATHAAEFLAHSRGLVKKCVNARQAAAFWVGDTAGISMPSA